jgi:hypothetical protein
MKKVLLGCGILVLVLGIGGAVGAYYFLWKPGKALVAEVAKLKEIQQLNQQVRNTAPFAAPVDQTLTNDRVDRFIRTQQQIQSALGQKAAAFKAKYDTLERSLAPGQTPSWPVLANAYKDLAGLIVDAKRAQVEALNQHSFSLAEYDWTRHRVYEAAGIPINVDFEKILRDISEGKKPGEIKQSETDPESRVTIPEQNRTLVTPYQKELTDRAVLAAFGL